MIRPPVPSPAWLGLLATSLVLACGPNPKAPVKVMALIPSAEGLLTQQQVELQTITNMTALAGQVAHLVGGVSVVLDNQDPLQNVGGGLPNQTEAQRWAGIVKNEGMPVRGHFIDKGGVLWPEDFHTWNMVTTYYNFERAYQYFTGVYDGKDPVELRDMRVFYWADYRPYTITPTTDNALFLSVVQSFVLLPQQKFQIVPLAMNIGIIGHEVAHKVFNHKVLGDAGVHKALVNWSTQPFNLLKSIDEGFSDFHGYGVTVLEPSGRQPAFLKASIDDSPTLSSRDLSRPNACLDTGTRSALQSWAPEQWIIAPELYKYGGLWAAAMYQAAEKSGKLGVMQRALVAAYDDDSPRKGLDGGPGLNQFINRNIEQPQNVFTPEAVADIILAHVTDPQLKKDLCSQFLTRLQLHCTKGTSTQLCAEIPACPLNSSADSATCPTLPESP